MSTQKDGVERYDDSPARGENPQPKVEWSTDLYAPNGGRERSVNFDSLEDAIDDLREQLERKGNDHWEAGWSVKIESVEVEEDD